jgi:HK97 family phage major capsid protein
MSAIAEVEGLRHKRADAFETMKGINDKAEAESRDLTAEEKQEFERVEGEFDSLTERIERTEKLEGLSSRAAAPLNPETREVEEETEAPTSFRDFNEKRAGTKAQDTPEYREAFFRWVTASDERELDQAEFRVLSKASAGAGLNLVPTSFRNELVEALREFGVIRNLATVITTTSGDAIQVPAVTAHGTAAWVAENAAYTASDETFGLATLNAYKAGTLIKVSEELMADSAFDLDAYIRREFGSRIGVLENTGYVAGDGSGKPTGVATQATAGVTAAGAAAITSDELIDLFHSLLPPYRANASWLFKDSSIKLVRKLKDADNQYLWQPGLQAGAPDTLLGKPVYADPDMAAATTGLVSVLFGDFSYYWIRDVDGIAFQRLNELYAENGQIGFRAFHRTDGELLNTAAVKKLTQA